MNYQLAYRLGFHPWEDAATDPPFVDKIEQLFAREEEARQPPYGKVLDLGTGSAIWGVRLAQRGWEVTGVDIVDPALTRARHRARDAGVSLELMHADVTALRADGVGSGFRLVLDTGTFHGLDESQQLAMGREVNAVASSDATVLLLVWPKRRRPLIRGASRADIESAFPDWRVTHVEPSHFSLPRVLQWVLRPDEHWYRLRRK
jgi:SAM-dependent methyltransferase